METVAPLSSRVRQAHALVGRLVALRLLAPAFGENARPQDDTLVGVIEAVEGRFVRLGSGCISLLTVASLQPVGECVAVG